MYFQIWKTYIIDWSNDTIFFHLNLAAAAVMAAVVATTAAAVTGSTAAIPAPVAPADWAAANSLPAATVPP